MTSLINILNFLRITDSGVVSLANIAVIITLYKLASAPTLSVTDMTALVVALCGHHFQIMNNKDSNV